MLRKLFVFVVCLMAAITTASAQTPPNNEIWYTTTDGYPIDSYYSKRIGAVSNIYRNGKGILQFSSNVTSINHAFRGCKKITSITLPNTVTSFVAVEAFSGCSNLRTFKGKLASSDGRCLIINGLLVEFAPAGLTSYTIPNSVTEIGRSVFSNCDNLIRITIPNSVRHIQEAAFYNCNKMASVNIPNSVTSIGYAAFRSCSSLTSITIPESVKSIGSHAFEGCCSLTSITIPDSVTSIERYAFSDCRSLTSITIPNSVTSIEYGAFYNCSSLKSITIPNSVTSIGGSAFAGCSSLKSVKVTNEYCYDYFKYKVDDIAFYGANASDDGRCLIIDGELKIFSAKGITEYTIPESVTSIRKGAFDGCSSLTSITIPNSVKSIGHKTFAGCKSLTSITIPESVTSIGEWAFEGCSSLTSITIPNSVTSIGDKAFQHCSSLKSITIGNSVTSIGELAFMYCGSLTSITIPNSVTSIGRSAFSGCRSLTSITIPNSVTEIGGGAFSGCSGLTSITIGNSVTEIGSWVFEGCSSLKSFNGKYASSDGRCLIIDGELIAFAPAGLTSYTIPNSVTSIGEKAFYRCYSLTSITCLATTPPAIDDLMIGETTMIYVPKEAVKAYKKDPEWSRYKKQIKAIK